MRSERKSVWTAVAEGIRAGGGKRVRDEERLVCKRKYCEVDALVNFELMERFGNMRDVTGSRSIDYSAGWAVLDSRRQES